MYAFWIAIIVSAGISVFVAYQVDDISGLDIVYLILLFLLLMNVIVEILKWPLGKRVIDNSRGLASHIFKDADEPLWGFRFFPGIDNQCQGGRYS